VLIIELKTFDRRHHRLVELINQLDESQLIRLPPIA